MWAMRTFFVIVSLLPVLPIILFFNAIMTRLRLFVFVLIRHFSLHILEEKHVFTGVSRTGSGKL